MSWQDTFWRLIVIQNSTKCIYRKEYKRITPGKMTNFDERPSQKKETLPLIRQSSIIQSARHLCSFSSVRLFYERGFHSVAHFPLVRPFISVTAFRMSSLTHIRDLIRSLRSFMEGETQFCFYDACRGCTSLGNPIFLLFPSAHRC